MLRNGRSLRSYNDFAGRNGSGHCGDATMPRDSPWAHRDDERGREDSFLRRPNLHRIERPHALKIPARRAEYSLTENVASPFQAEPRQTKVAELLSCEGTLGNNVEAGRGGVEQDLILSFR
jgi:hypothetical protein